MAIERGGYYSEDVLRGNVASDGTLTLRHRSPDIGERIVYLAVTVENLTSANSNFRIGVRGAMRFVLRRAFLSVAADSPQTYDGAVIVVSDDKRLEVQVTNGTSGDEVEAHLSYHIARDFSTD
jgi:hypothetical protein